jgi:large conductance mechanosensitive channel
LRVVNFSNPVFTVKEAFGDVPVVIISYGKFIQAVVDYTIIALTVFMGQGTQFSQTKKEVVMQNRLNPFSKPKNRRLQ